MFKEANWILVMHGLGLIPKAVAEHELTVQPAHLIESMKYNIANMIGTNDTSVTKYVDHRAALQWLIDNPEQI
jgi:hypothetical protein